MERLGASQARLRDAVAELVKDVGRNWPEHADLLSDAPFIRDGVAESIQRHTKSLLRSGG